MIVMGCPQLSKVDKKYHEAFGFLNSFKLTKWDIRVHVPQWEIDYIIQRGEEEKIPNLKEFIELIKTRKI